MRSNKSAKIERWINPVYMQEETMQALKKAFAQAQDIPHIQLQDFFRPEKAKTLSRHLQRCYYQQHYVPDNYRYAEAHQIQSLNPVQEVFQDPLFKLWLEEITGKMTTMNQIRVIRYVHGDYMLIHDSATPEEGLLLIYDPAVPWQSEAGGYEVFTLSKKDPLVVHPQANTLVMIWITRETRHFTKYVNSLSQSKKRYTMRCLYKK